MTKGGFILYLNFRGSFFFKRKMTLKCLFFFNITQGRLNFFIPEQRKNAYHYFIYWMCYSITLCTNLFGKNFFYSHILIIITIKIIEEKNNFKPISNTCTISILIDFIDQISKQRSSLNN